jgi:RNA polymerase sigma factor (sigma-70 family)
MQPFDAIVAAHGPVVMRVCRALLGPADAEDAWSETFLAALRAYPDLRPRSNVRGWLVTIAHHKAIDQIRGRERNPLPAAAPPEAASEDRPPVPLDDELRASLEALAPKQRSAVVHRYLADLSYREIAAILGGSEAAARRNAADGIAKLRSTYTGGTHDD